MLWRCSISSGQLRSAQVGKSLGKSLGRIGVGAVARALPEGAQSSASRTARGVIFSASVVSQFPVLPSEGHDHRGSDA